MKIAVCVKSVPSRTVCMDEKSGNLVRELAGTSLNLYDYAAVEAALRVRESSENGRVTVFSMGPAAAETALREALALGVDEAVLLCDGAFRGADVLATSYTLAKALLQVGEFDLVICGKQTTDGDTAQVPGALAAQLQYSYVPWVRNIEKVQKDALILRANMGECLQHLQAGFPLVLSVEPNQFMPRTASLSQKLKSRKQTVRILTQNELALDADRVGAKGSKTHVVRVKKNGPKVTEMPKTMGAMDALAIIEAECRKVGET